MTISIDGQENKQLETTGRTIGDVLDEAKKILADSGRIIVSIVCDGETILPDQIKQTSAEPASKYTSIDFQTAMPDELVRSSLATCKDFITTIQRDLAEVVDCLRQSRVQDAMVKIGPIFALLNQTHRGIFNVFKLMDVDPGSIELSWGTAEQLLTGLVDHLQQIKQALQNNDYVQLADLFEYELGTMLERWQELIDHMGTLIAEE
jgi:hypothetical protein